MLRKSELVEAKERLLNEEKSTFQNCEKLAAVCTVLDHCYPENTPVFERNYSGDSSDTVGSYGDSEFLRGIEGMNPQKIFPLVDELVTATMVYNPRLYRAFMRKLTNK